MARSNHSLADAMGGGIGLISVVLLLLTVYLLVKCLNLIFRVLLQHGNKKLLWVFLLCFVLFTAIAVATHGEPLPVLLSIASFIALVICCRIIELYHGQLFAEKGVDLTTMFRRPWWKGNTNTTIAA